MKHITVSIYKQFINNDMIDRYSCPLGASLEKKYPGENIFIQSDKCYIGDYEYLFSISEWNGEVIKKLRKSFPKNGFKLKLYKKYDVLNSYH